MDDRYNRSDMNRQDRYQDFDHRDRGRYQEDGMMDRRDNVRAVGGDRDGQVRGGVSWEVLSCTQQATVIGDDAGFEAPKYVFVFHYHYCRAVASTAIIWSWIFHFVEM